MSRNLLFQVVDPNAGQTCTIVTFQKQDHHFIERCKTTLEAEIRATLADGEHLKVFTDDSIGIWFGGNVRKKNGRPITLSVPNKADYDYIKTAETFLNNPPKKHDFNAHNQHQIEFNKPPSQITYHGMVQAQCTQTIQSVSVQDNEGTTTTTTTQMSQTVTATMEARFQVIESEIKTQRDHQTGMDHRLMQLEDKATTIDENISAMMVHWRINPTQKHKADNELQDNPGNMEDDGTRDPTASSYNMDHGDMDECL
jgi:hypothetical protein